MNELKDDYIPFGPEWEAEMKKLPKSVLIDMIKANKIKETEKSEATEEILVPVQEGISELISGISFIDDSDKIKIIEAINYYFEYSWDVIENIYSKVTTEEQVFNSVQRLTSLQEELGYKKGELSTVAMLGLVGEAGEVLNEVSIEQHSISDFDQISDAISTCKDIEKLKKEVRNGSSDFSLEFFEGDNKDFKAELADSFYYMNILATNVGLTVFDLAQMAHDKIKRKQAEGGSSEDRKP